MDMIDLEAFRRTPLDPTPFDHICVPGFVPPQALAAINSDFPDLTIPGSVPLDVAPHGPAFAALIAALRGPAIEAAFAEKFQVPLAGRPRMFTVRAMCRPEDGQVHVDSASKLITVLIYLNPGWRADGGRLRLLRSPDLEDFAAEVPPDAGTLLAFRRSARSWHGHYPYAGPRRAIQMNWVSSGLYVWHEQWRHRLNARRKLRAAARDASRQSA